VNKAERIKCSAFLFNARVVSWFALRMGDVWFRLVIGRLGQLGTSKRVGMVQVASTERSVRCSV